MNRFTFLPRMLSFSLLALVLWTFLNSPIYLKFLLVIFSSFLFYLFRRASIPYRDTLKNNGEIYLSPVHGTIQSIRRDTTILGETSPSHEIRIALGLWDEKGLYLPTSGEVSYLKANQGIKIERSALTEAFYKPLDILAHTDFILTSKNQTRTLMRFIDCKWGRRPTIWLKSGDRGRGAACFGYYPFGGTLLIYLPNNSDILVFEKEKIVPGQTVLAALKDLK